MFRRALLNLWILAIGCLAFTIALGGERPRTMEMRAGPRHGIVGMPIDAGTRIVAPLPLEDAGGGQGPIRSAAHATFEVINSTTQPLAPEALVALHHALDIWSRLINSPVPIKVGVRMGANLGFLATGSAPIYRDFLHAPLPNVWYSKPLANALAGVDVQPGTGADIGIDFADITNWSFGTDGHTPSGQYDFVSVALHEIGHHLGVVPMMWGDGGWGQWSVMHEGDAHIYSRFIVNGAGQSLLNTSLFPNPGSALGAQLASNNLFWSGPAAMAALGGVRPKIYAPNPWRNGQGSSLNHLDEATYPPGDPNSLMTPIINTAEAIHVPGPALLGMLTDMGWQADTTCAYAVNTTDVFVQSSDGVMGTVVNVVAPALCQWTAVSNSPFITVTSGASRNGPSPMTFSVAANPGTYRTGSLTIAGQTVTVRQNGAAPAMSVDKTTLNFGAASSGSTFSSQTPSQIVRLRQSGAAGTVTWTAQATQPWLQISPASGTGSADLSISVVPAAGVPLSGTVSGAIQLTLTGSGTLAGPIAVTLTTVPSGQTAPPFGFIDTPADFTSGVTGAIAMTGWALDDIGIERVTICRTRVATEAPGPNPLCGGRDDIFVGFGVRVDGARPDVQTGYATYPLNSMAGWGFMILTNMLPYEGNGGYVFLAWAFDREGHATRLGVRTILCDNNAATKPFGAIDTPEQGGVASGSAYANFGWALTQMPKTIPTDGSTITVMVDGQSLGNATYNNYRPDIATLFPNRQNSNGAVGYRIIDTTRLQNGVHTISWVVTDDAGVTEGIGSRYFIVSNGAGAMTAAATAVNADARAVDAAPREPRAVLGRRGFDPNAPWTSYGVGSDGRALVRAEELDRIELSLPSAAGERLTGFLRVGDRLAPLPAGSHLDAASGAFTWAPGVGFVGTYDLEFLRSRQARVVSRQQVRVVLAARNSGRVGPQITIDRPRPEQDVAQPFTLAGWAADLGAAAGTGVGTGVGTVHVWAYPLAGGPPVFLGAAASNGARPDVAAVHGERFRDSGFSVAVQGLAPGPYNLAAFAWSLERGDFAPAHIVRVTVR